MSLKNGLLIVTCLSKLQQSLSLANKKVLQNLYIHYHPQEPQKYENLSKTLFKIYTSSIEICDNNVDVRVLIGTTKSKRTVIDQIRRMDFVFVDQNECTTPLLVNIAEQLGLSEGVDSLIDETSQAYNSVVLGGTFDRLHVGHKILLSEAAMRAKKRVVVGVTDSDMLSEKKLKELVLPLHRRIQDVREFLIDIDNTVNYEIVPIHDPFGPTVTDPDMDMIVVSSETERGGEKINAIRDSKGFRPLDIYSIPLVEVKQLLVEKEGKVSSSNQRMDMLGSLFRKPGPRPNLPAKPYIIGLIGGIASGKSKMSERFQAMGAGVIDCDKLAHSLYKPDEECYADILRHFGNEILVENSDMIDRQKLGKIVFSDKAQLQALNSIVWPALLKSAKAKTKELHEVEKKQVVILEAAVLLQAGWETETHEIWSCIIPSKVAVQRVMERNKLSEDEAKARVSAQPKNSFVVEHSNVVFSSLWSFEYSQAQAEKAWSELLQRLNATAKI